MNTESAKGESLTTASSRPSRPCPPPPTGAPPNMSATSKRSGSATGSWSAARPISSQPLAYRVFTIGTQQVLVLRDELGELRAFHNTCRHRGSQLCREIGGAAEGAAAHLSLSRLVLFVARRTWCACPRNRCRKASTRRTIRFIRSRFRLARLRLRQSCRRSPTALPPPPSTANRPTCRTGRWKAW